MTYRYIAFLPLLVATLLYAQGETCATAVPVDIGTHTADGPATGAGATQGDAANADWYAFTPVVDAFLSLWSCGSQVDTRLFLHTGACGTLALVDSDDDGCPEGYPPGSSFLANVPVTAGTTYYIEWDDRYSADGFDWQLQLHGCPIAVPVITPGEGTLSVDWPVLAVGAAFTLEYGAPGFTPGDGTLISGVQGEAQPPVVIIGLEGNTEYDVHISVDCGGGNTAPFNGPWHGTTLGIEEIANDYCDGAIPVTCGQSVAGSTIGAIADDVEECGTPISAAGVWYTFIATTNYARLRTCAEPGYDTKINLYEGACDELECVGGNDDGLGGCYPGSDLLIPVEPGVTYYALVQGYDGAVGTFNLELSCAECGFPYNVFVAPTHNQAQVYWESTNASLSGTTYSLEYGPAGFMPGTGTVITGTVGVDGPPLLITGLDLDTDYGVYIQETCPGGALGEIRGPYAFTTLAQPAPFNAFCDGSLPITCGDALEGNTTGSVQLPTPDCGSAWTEAPGLWYAFTGTGDEVTLTTCNAAEFDTKISVYSGSCAGLVCVAGNDDAFDCGGNTSRVTFVSMIGTEYRVLVHGYDGETGAFTLSMTCSEACAPGEANDDCTGAIVLAPQATGNCVPVTGSNVCAYASGWANPPCDPYSIAADVWYMLPTGPSSAHLLTAAALTIGEFGVSLYGGCDQSTFIACFDPQAGPIELTGLDPQTNYYLRVWNGGGTQGGTFTLCDEADVVDGLDESGMAAGLSVWPVPAEDLLNITGLHADTRSLRVLDAQGREVLRASLHSGDQQVVDVSLLPAGAYVLRTEGGVPQVVRFVVR